MDLVRFYYPQWGKPIVVSLEEEERAENSFRQKYAQRITATGWVRVCQECEKRFPTRYPQRTLCSEVCAAKRRRRLKRYRDSLLTACARVGCERRFEATRQGHIYCSDACKKRKLVSAQRRCARCREPLPRDAHARKKFCSDTCRVLHFKQQQRTARNNPNLGRVLPPADDSLEV